MIVSTAPEMQSRRSFPVIAAWLTVAILILFQFQSYVDRQLLSLLVPQLKSGLGLSDTDVSLLQGLAFVIFYSCAGIPIGIAADRYSRRYILLAGIVFFSLASAACGLMTSFQGLFACRMLVGIGEAVVTPIALSIISDNFPRERLAAAMGVFGMSPFIGFGGALIIGGSVINALMAIPKIVVPVLGHMEPWQAAFMITALPGIPFALLALALRDPRPPIRSVPDSQRTEARSAKPFAGRTRILAYHLSGFGILAMISYVTLAWTPAFMIRHYGWSPASIGLRLGPIVMITGMVSSFVFGQVVSRFVRKGRPDAYFVVPAICCVIAVPFFICAYLADNPWVTLGSISIAFLLTGSMGPSAYTSIQLIVPAAGRARAAALFVFTCSVTGAAGGPLLVALITDHVFGDDRRLGGALALVLSIAIPAGSIILLLGRKELKRILALAEE